MSLSAVQFYVRTEHFNLMDGTIKLKAQTKKKEINSTPNLRRASNVIYIWTGCLWQRS